MANDILGRKLTGYAGSFALDDALLTFPNLKDMAGFVPYIVTQMQAQYAQQISRFYGINRAAVLLAAGRPSGNASLNQILAPDGSLGTFYSTYGDVCNAKNNVLQFSLGSGCGDNSSSNSNQKKVFRASIAVIEQLGLSADAQTAVINNSFTMTFQSLEYE